MAWRIGSLDSATENDDGRVVASMSQSIQYRVLQTFPAI